jgi:hypothetical protein
MAPAEFSINLIAWIGIPDETNDFYEELTVFSEPGVACFQERKGSVADVGVLRAEHPIDVGSRYCAVFDHDECHRGDPYAPGRRLLCGKVLGSGESAARPAGKPNGSRVAVPMGTFRSPTRMRVRQKI